MKYIGIRNREYSISETQMIGKGREGRVYRAQSDSGESVAVKLYSEDLLSDHDYSNQLEIKLKSLISKPVVETFGVFSIAWPRDLVYKEEGGKRWFAGYVQRIVDGNCTLSNIIRNKFPNDHGDGSGGKKSLTWNQAIKAAYNLAYFVAYLHSMGIILGDFNENNFIFNDKTGGYGLIDCGNYGLVNETKTTVLFPSSFFMPNYRTPESILGYAPKEPFSSDYFFLAIHIFNILSVNANPFRSISKDVESNNDFVIEDAIVNGECLYVRQIAGKQLPADAPNPDYFPSDILDGFKHTFQYSKSTIQESISRRTTAEQWCRILRPYVEKKKSFAQYDSRVGIKKATMLSPSNPSKERVRKKLAEQVVAHLVGSYIQGDASADYYFNRLYPERDAVLTQQGIKRIEDYFPLDDLNAPYNATLKRSILTAINEKERSRIVLEPKQTPSSVSPASSNDTAPTQKKASADFNDWQQQWEDAKTHNKKIIARLPKQFSGRDYYLDKRNHLAKLPEIPDWYLARVRSVDRAVKATLPAGFIFYCFAVFLFFFRASISILTYAVACFVFLTALAVNTKSREFEPDLWDHKFYSVRIGFNLTPWVFLTPVCVGSIPLLVSYFNSIPDLENASLVLSILLSILNTFLSFFWYFLADRIQEIVYSLLERPLARPKENDVTANIIVTVTVLLLLVLGFALYRMVINTASADDAQNHSTAITVLENSDLLENEQTQISTDIGGGWGYSDNSQTRPHYYCYDDTTSVSLLGDGVVNFGPGVWVDSNEPVNYNSFVYQEFCDRLEHDPVMAAAVFAYADKQLGTRYTGSFYSEIKDDWITGINNAAETFVNDMNLWAGETNAFEELLESTADISIINAGVMTVSSGSREPLSNELCPCGSGLKFKNCHGIIIKNTSGDDIKTLKMQAGDEHPVICGPETLNTTVPWKYLCFTINVKNTRIALLFLIDVGFQPVI